MFSVICTVLLQERNTLTSRAVHAVDGGKNLASHVSDLFHGEPLTLSMSADKDVRILFEPGCIMRCGTVAS